MGTDTVGKQRVNKCLNKEGHKKAKMAATQALQPKQMIRPKVWNDEVEEAYRLMCAGFKDIYEYRQINNTDEVDRWPHNDYIKKLKRKDGCFNYFNRQRECPDKDINKCKLYVY